WLLGDDDRMVRSAVGKMLQILSTASYDLVLVNGGRKTGEKALGRVREKLPSVYTDQNKLLIDLGWHSTWISCLIFGKKMIKEADFEKYFNTNFLQFSVIFNYLEGKQFRVYWQPEAMIYGLRRDLPAWISSMFEVFGVRWMKAINALPDSYSLSAKAACIRSHGVKSGLFSARKLLFFRLVGYYNLGLFNQYKNILPSLIGYPLWLAYIIAAFPIPKVVSRILREGLEEYLKRRKRIV
ncbi:MAG: hypothetical protein QME05_04815, partial [Candidatus Margulisbacteria bacterium]|nr:hypothetical protein [Candidatus Margulisiibacteriota bacterium]